MATKGDFAIEEPQAIVPVARNTMELLSIAINNHGAIDVIERVAAIHKEAMEREAMVAFNEAMNRTQTEIRRIAPDMENTQTRSKYASYAAIDRVIRPIYSKQGFSLSFNTADCPIPEHVRVLCYVSLGAHTRTYQVDMPADGKGAKGGDVMTKTHATGAAMQYGMRYLLKYIFNIAIGAEDTDGNPVTNGAVMEQLEWIANCRSKEELKSVFGQAWKQFESDAFALKALVAAEKKRRQELS